MLLQKDKSAIMAYTNIFPSSNHLKFDNFAVVLKPYSIYLISLFSQVHDCFYTILACVRSSFNVHPASSVQPIC